MINYSTIPIKRLDFRLPDFTRWTWVSKTARDVWEPRINRIVTCWQELERLSVSTGLRACALQVIAKDSVADFTENMRQQNLAIVIIQSMHRTAGVYRTVGEVTSSEPVTDFRVVIGSAANTQAFQTAWLNRDEDSIGRLLGYPECCRKFFQSIWVEQGFIDTTWPMALNTRQPRIAEPNVIELDGFAEANVLLRWLGIRLVSHLPCGFDCPATHDLASRYLALGCDSGYVEEMSWLSDMLNWPVEWSALHGIAEIKTPILKITALTDATAERYVVRRHGRSYPPEGAQGLVFPYSQPVHLRLTESPGYQKGLDHIQPASLPAWHYTDNGFQSADGMNRAHQPLIDVAKQTLQSTSGSILDLGCGNAALLLKICKDKSDFIPYGVEIHESKILHGQTLIPEYPDNLFVGDIFDSSGMWRNQQYDLVILMLGRLLEVDDLTRENLKNWLLISAKNIIVYVYPDYLQQDQTLSTLAEKAGIELLPNGTSQVSLARIIT